jgi:hypothetical protein
MQQRMSLQRAEKADREKFWIKDCLSPPKNLNSFLKFPCEGES